MLDTVAMMPLICRLMVVDDGEKNSDDHYACKCSDGCDLGAGGEE